MPPKRKAAPQSQDAEPAPKAARVGSTAKANVSRHKKGSAGSLDAGSQAAPAVAPANKENFSGDVLQMVRQPRSTRGQGGYVSQLEKAAQAIAGTAPKGASNKTKAGRKATAASIPDDVEENPMAPPQRKGRSTSTQKNATTPPAAGIQLGGAPLPTAQLASQNSRFGLTMDAASSQTVNSDPKERVPVVEPAAEGSYTHLSVKQRQHQQASERPGPNFTAERNESRPHSLIYSAQSLPFAGTTEGQGDTGSKGGAPMFQRRGMYGSRSDHRSAHGSEDEDSSGVYGSNSGNSYGFAISDAYSSEEDDGGYSSEHMVGNRPAYRQCMSPDVNAIDERSPSEDEAEAQEALARPAKYCYQDDEDAREDEDREGSEDEDPNEHEHEDEDEDEGEGEGEDEDEDEDEDRDGEDGDADEDDDEREDGSLGLNQSRVNHSAYNRHIGTSSPDTDSCDVVAAHRSRNRAMHPPKLSTLADAAARQQYHKSNREASLDNTGSTSGVSMSEASNKGSPISHSRAPRNSKGQRNSSSITVRFYGPSWKSPLVAAKYRWQRYIALFNAFPVRGKHLQRAGSILVKCIVAHEKEGHTFDTNHSRNRDMDITIFNEHSTFRGALKDVARTIVLAKYSSVVSPDIEAPNQQELYDLVQDGVARILQGGRFLQASKPDKDGYVQNIAHPAIKAVILQFFYEGEDCLARLFPDDFKDKVPDKVIALVMTCIRCCLEEYKRCGYRETIPFSGPSGNRYDYVYETMLKLIAKVKSDPYHAKKYRERRIRWAQEGMKLLDQNSAVPQDAYDMDVILERVVQ